LRYIGEEAFALCSLITKVVIPSSVADIGENVFAYCNIDDLTAPVSAHWLFLELSPSYITITNGDIPSGAFYYSENLKKVTLLNGVTGIGKGAFNGCKALEEINIPESVTKISKAAFTDCTSLTSITFAVTKGWCAYSKDPDAEYDEETEIKAIPLADLSDPAEAVKIVTSTYRSYTLAIR